MAAATPAECPSTIKTGSIRIELNATCEADTQTGTSKFLHSVDLGVIASKGMENGPEA
jgi:hypothetical protein